MRSASSMVAMTLVGLAGALGREDLLGLSPRNDQVEIVKRQSNLGSPYNGYQYVGCWSDASGMRTLSNGPNNYDTIETCINYCASSTSGGPYNYAAIEYHGECYCGNTLARGSYQAPESDCSDVCNGDNTELCGGGFRLSLYALADAVPTSTATALPTGTYTPPAGQKVSVSPGPYDYVGCFTDQVDGSTRALTGALAYAANTMSLETCANLCNTYQPDLLYFGVEDGGECFCGSGIQSPNHIVDESNCNEQCTGDPNENCGAPNFINIYSDDPAANYYSVSGGAAGNNGGGNGGGNAASSRSSASSVASASRASASASRASASSAASVSRESVSSVRSVATASYISYESAYSASRLSAESSMSAASVANSISRASASSAASVSRASESSARSVASASALSASIASASSRSSASSSVSSRRSSVSSASSSRSSDLSSRISAESSISSRLSSHSSLTASRSSSSNSNQDARSSRTSAFLSSESVASASLASAASSRSSVSSVASVSRASAASSRSSVDSSISASKSSVSASKASVSSSLSAAAAATTEVYRYVNCFNYDPNNPPLPLHPYMHTLSLQGCANKCYNHTYFGVAEGSQCYCGPDLSAAGSPIPISNCYSNANAIACTANAAEKCGADAAMPIFGQERYIGDCSQANYYNPSDPCRIVTGSKGGTTLARLPGSSSTFSSGTGLGTGSYFTRPTGGLNSTTSGLPTGTRLPGSRSVCVVRTAIINVKLHSTVDVYPTGWQDAFTIGAGPMMMGSM